MEDRCGQKVGNIVFTMLALLAVPQTLPGLKVANFDEYLARIRAGIVRNKEIRTSEDGQNT